MCRGYGDEVGADRGGRDRARFDRAVDDRGQGYGRRRAVSVDGPLPTGAASHSPASETTTARCSGLEE